YAPKTPRSSSCSTLHCRSPYAANRAGVRRRVTSLADVRDVTLRPSQTCVTSQKRRTQAMPGFFFSRRAVSYRPRGVDLLSGDEGLEQERDHEAHEHERLDERQAEDHRGLDAGSSAGVTADAFESCCSSLTLTEAAAEHRKTNCKTGADGRCGLSVKAVCRCC